MFLTIKHIDSGLTRITEYSEENIFNKTFKQDTTKVYKVHNSLFKNGVFKFAGKRLNYLSGRNFRRDFPKLYEKCNVKRTETPPFGRSKASVLSVPTNIMKEYYDRFINIGTLESNQDDPDKYKIILGRLLYVQNPKSPFRKHMLSGNIHFKGATYGLS